MGDATLQKLFRHNLTCDVIEQHDRKNISSLFRYISSVGVYIGAGIRITIEVHNEVRLLCTGVKEIKKLNNTVHFNIGYTKWRMNRRLLIPHINGTNYSITCKRVLIESHEQYCCDEDGNKTPLDQALQQYKDSGPQLREWLNELKKKRDAERAQQHENN